MVLGSSCADADSGAMVSDAATASAIRTAAQEFAPDLFIVTGPGTTLGGAVAQSLILARWRGMGGKTDFQKTQADQPLLVAMGMSEQRGQVTQQGAIR